MWSLYYDIANFLGQYIANPQEWNDAAMVLLATVGAGILGLIALPIP